MKQFLKLMAAVLLSGPVLMFAAVETPDVDPYDVSAAAFVELSDRNWSEPSPGELQALGLMSPDDPLMVVYSSSSVWIPRDAGTASHLFGVGAHADRWVAVGAGGLIRTSSDGVTWSAATSGVSDLLLNVNGEGPLIVAVGEDGRVLTSPDGLSWTARTTPTTQMLRGIAYGDGIYVACGENGTVIRSTDGITWTSQSSGTTEVLQGVAYGGGQFVAVGAGGVIRTSPDGVTWTARTSGTGNWLLGVAYGDGVYVAVGLGGIMRTSSDGVSWTARTSGTSAALYRAAHGQGRFVVIGASGTIIGSEDGVTWTAESSGVGSDLRGVTHRDETFAAVGFDGTLLTSGPESEPVFPGDASTPASQPAGALSDIVVFTSAGHGFTFVTSPDRWVTQRPLLHGMVEDMGNIDQFNMFADYIFRAGGTVVPFRPLGYQTNEVVLDNVDAGVTFGGTWHDSVSPIYYGNPGETPYRYAAINTTGTTAWAIYRPTLPEAGFYPVYTWVRHGSDRVRQLYRVYHSGGVTDVRVNHRRVGNGWVWLGNYHFEAGTAGSVNISNYAPDEDPGATRWVFADAIRFGNGMGDVARGSAGISGFEREMEASRYWVQRMVGQGMSSSLYDAFATDWNDNVGAPARMSAEMNRHLDGGFWDRIYLGFHSNAHSGSSRGPLGLWDNRGTTLKQNRQKDYGLLMANEIHADMTWANGQGKFLDAYANNTANLYGAGFGEIYGTVNDQMNSTIIETLFHDNATDANLLKDPVARLVMARSCYKAIVRHLSTNNAAVPLDLLPEPPTALSAVNAGGGSLRISWTPPEVIPAGGDAATGYVVYRSTNGYGFGNPVRVPGGATTSITFTNLTISETYYFQVAATNSGGESLPSKTVGARIAPGERAHHLVVNGFERFDRTQTPSRYFANNLNGNVALVRPRRMNSFDYVIQHGEALAAAGRYFDSCDNTALLAHDLSLTNYFAAYWILGRESTRNTTFDADEQNQVKTFLDLGGNLFLSGTDIGWDLDHLGTAADRNFMTNHLKAAYAADDSGNFQVTPTTAGIFNGIGSFFFDDGSGDTYRAAFPDVYHTHGGSQSALVYGESSSGSQLAGVQYDGASKVVHLGFPFETIRLETTRNSFMTRVTDFFGEDPAAPPSLAITDDSRTVAKSVTNWTIHGTCINAEGLIRWTNSAGGSGTVPVASPWSLEVSPLELGENLITVTVTNSGGSASRSITITRSEQEGGNCWHIPNHAEPGEHTMRMPLAPTAFQTIYIVNGNQFAGEGNAADQSGGTVYYRRQGVPSWSEVPLGFIDEVGLNKYWQAAIPGGTYQVGDIIEYYIEVTYTDRDVTYIGTQNEGVDSVTFQVQSEAASHPFRFTLQGYPGNAWHIPANTKPGGDTMLVPLEPHAHQAVWIASGNQFQGEGNAANQTGGALFHRRQGDALWQEEVLVYLDETGNDKYWHAPIPGHAYEPDDVIEYYLAITYDDRDTTYLSLDSGGERFVGTSLSFARQFPYNLTYEPPAFGNSWHIPASEQPETVTMRNPLVPHVDWTVFLYVGTQTNDNNQTGGALHFRVAGDEWTHTLLEFDSNAEGGNQYWVATIPADTYAVGDRIEYCFAVTYSCADTTYIGTIDEGADYVRYGTLSAARAHPFDFVYTAVDPPPPPAIQPASHREETAFQANWLASSGATNYLLDVSGHPSFAQEDGPDYVVDFEDATKRGYASGPVELGGYEWDMTQALIGDLDNDFKTGEQSARFRGYEDSSMTMLEAKPGGLGTITFLYRRYGTDTQVDWQVDYSTNAWASWEQIGESFTALATNEVQTFSNDVHVAGNVLVRIRRATADGNTNDNRRLNVDDIVMTSRSVPSYVPGYQARSLGNTTHHSVTGLTEGTTYYYRLRAQGPGGISEYSSVQMVAPLVSETETTPVPVPHDWLQHHYPGETDFEALAWQVAESGMTVWQAYVAGTDPTQADSAFDIRIPASQSGNGNVISWPSVEGRLYRVFFATHLGAEMEPLGEPLHPTPPLNTYTDAVYRVGPAFYRISVELAE